MRSRFFTRRIWKLSLLIVIMVALFAVNVPIRTRAETLAGRTIGVSLNKVTFGSSGVTIHASMNANNLRSSDIRIAAFFFWADDSTMPASSFAPNDYQTTSGYLTEQKVLTAPYQYTTWSDITFYIPNSYFPSVDQVSDAYIQIQGGLDGYDFVAFSSKHYFHINP